MGRGRLPATPAVRVLRAQGVAFTPWPYRYQEHGGTAAAARALGLDEDRVVKTLVLEDEASRPLIVLMPGDREVSTRALARLLEVKSVRPCDPKTAQKHTGYTVGGISPFGTKNPLPVYMEASILKFPSILINAGKRGLLVEISPQDLVRVLEPTKVTVGVQNPPLSPFFKGGGKERPA